MIKSSPQFHFRRVMASDRSRSPQKTKPVTFEEEFDDKSESDESINPNDNNEDDTIILLFPNLEGILFWTSGVS